MRGRKKDGSGDYDFFSCSDRECNTTYGNVNGEPGKAQKKPEPTKYKCIVCGKPLVLREGRKGKYFACTGYPACKEIYFEGNGKPQARKSKRSSK
jgi:DNA topoisomerase-1